MQKYAGIFILIKKQFYLRGCLISPHPKSLSLRARDFKPPCEARCPFSLMEKGRGMRVCPLLKQSLRINACFIE
jgi:hypothetical protein